jgi:hypothetical protein
MKTLGLLIFCLGLGTAADRNAIVQDPAQSKAIKDRYLALTDGWAKTVEFTPAERAAMEDGKQREDVLMNGPDDPLGKRIKAAGDPSFNALAAIYPGKILDRTILGSYSDPRQPLGEYLDEFAIYWNGAIGANLIKGRLTDRYGATGVQPIAFNTAVSFRVGPDGEAFGRDRRRFSSIGYERGYLPIVAATYEAGGVRYRETAFADKPAGETGGWDIAYVAFEMTNVSTEPRHAVLDVDVILNDGGKPSVAGDRVLDPAGALLLTRSDPRREFPLHPGESITVAMKIPFVPDARPLAHPATIADFEAAHHRVRDFWEGMLSKAALIEVPEERVNNVWRALLLQNFVLADGPRFTYGSGLRYNDSTYPQENGFATHVFAMYGFPDYADALQPWFVDMSITPEGAGRKYQNRRAMVLHHLLENYRLTGKTDLFDRFKSGYLRVADEIVADRHSTMTPVAGEKPLHWGLLPPDKPGADVQASTQTVYVLGHNITNAQGLADFGRFLIATNIDPARGRKYLDEAADFRKTLLSAMERAAIRVPGRPPFLDLQTLYFAKTPDYGPQPYDDLANGRLQGAYSHFWADMEFHYNFFNPDDQVGHWIADYLATRNGFALGLTRSHSRDPKTGNINTVYDGGYANYRLRSGAVDDFLLTFYGRLAFAMSRYTYVASEGQPFVKWNTELGGYVGAGLDFPNSASNADTLLMLRNALVLEELKDDVETGDLFLLRGAPRAWTEPGKQIRVERLRTYFGEVGMQVNGERGGVRATIDAPSGPGLKRLLLDVRRPVTKVLVNGADYRDCDFAKGVVRLAAGAKRYTVEVRY